VLLCLRITDWARGKPDTQRQLQVRRT
jgi:hypothetical protein